MDPFAKNPTLHEIARGHDGVVYLHRERREGAEHRVALKRLHPEVSEAHGARLHGLVARLSASPHRNLVPLGRPFVRDGSLWLPMPWIDGVDLRTWVRGEAASEHARPHLPLAFGQALQPIGVSAFTAAGDEAIVRVRTTFAQLAAALRHLHGLGVVHRDLRPENVRVTAAGRVVLLDLGLNAWVGEPWDPARAVGPIAYAAPECGLTGTVMEAAQDAYGLGVMLFEALTGTVPFGGSGDDVVVRKRTIAAPRPGFVVSGVPDDLDAWCAALLERSPALRRI